MAGRDVVARRRWWCLTTRTNGWAYAHLLETTRSVTDTTVMARYGKDVRRLSVGDLIGDSAPTAEARLMARFQAVMYLTGAVLLGLLLILPGNRSDVEVVIVLALLLAGLGGTLLAFSSVSEREVVVANWIGIMAVGAAIGTVRPMLIVPCFFAWPLLAVGTYLPPRRLVIDLVLSVVTLAASLFWLAAPGDRMPTFVLAVGLFVVICVVTAMWRMRFERLLREMRLLATTDQLTGVLNRHAFSSRMDALRDHPGPLLGIVMLDVDHFKQINDCFGHPSGDAVLRRLAVIVSECVEADHSVARVGGEEFALLLPGYSEGESVGLAERIRDRVGREIFDGGLRVRASFGVVAGPPGQGERMLVDADRALYVAKQRGRDRVVSWSECRRGTAGSGLSDESVCGRGDATSVSCCRVV